MNKNKLKKIAAFACAAALSGALAFSLTACGDNNDNKGDGGDGTNTTQDALKLDKSTASVKVGETVTVKVTAGLTGLVTWSSSDPTVASVTGSGNGNSSGVIKGLKEGTTTIKAKAGDYEATCSVTVEAKDVVVDKGEKKEIVFSDNADPGWTYWNGSKYGYPNGDGTVTEAYYYTGDNSASITYSATEANSATVPYTVQLRYNSPEYTGTSHDVSLTVVAPKAGTIHINGKDVEVKVGENNVEVEGYVEQGLYVQFGGKESGTPTVTGTNLTFEFKNIQFTSNVKTTLEAPEFSIASDTKVITITDTKNDSSKVEKYELGFFESETATEPAKTLVVTSGNALDLSSIPAGTYTVRIKAMNPTDGTVRDSAWSTAGQTLTVENPRTIIDATSTSGWYYDTTGNSSLDNAYVEDGVINIKNLNQWSFPYAFQLKHSYGSIVTHIKMTVHSATAGYIAFGSAESHKEVQIAADTDVVIDTDIVIPTEKWNGTFVICFGNNVSQWGGADLSLLKGDVTLSNVVITCAD